MSILSRFNRREKAIMLACVYLGGLMFSTIMMWWVVFFGFNVVELESIRMYDENGKERHSFVSGERVVVKAKFCSDKALGLAVYPSLDGPYYVRYPLENTIVLAKDGCVRAAIAFQIPKVRTGNYEFNATVQYQNNLVGRYNTVALPEIKMKVIDAKHTNE